MPSHAKYRPTIQMLTSKQGMNNETVDSGLKAQVLHHCFNKQGDSVIRVCLKQERGPMAYFFALN